MPEAGRARRPALRLPAKIRCAWRAVVGSGVALLLACLAASAQARTLELRAAQVTVTVEGRSTQQTVQLPYHWDRHHRGLPGEASFELPFDLDQVPTRSWGLYLPRLGNAYEVWLNGVLLLDDGDLQHFNGPDYAKTPRYATIAPGLLRSHNLFRVLIRADIGRRGGLAPLVVGPEDEVQALYSSDYRWRNTGSMAVVILSLMVGATALALWVTQVDPTVPGRRRKPRRDRLYLFAGLAELCWTISISDAIIENPPLPWPWWGVAVVVVMSAWACCMALFCLEVAGWSRLPISKWLRRWLAPLLLASSLLAATSALAWGYPLALTLWYATLSLGFLVFLPVFVFVAVRRGTLAHRMVAAVVLVNTLVAMRDLYVYRISPVYGENTLLRYSSVLFGLALGSIVILRFRSASRQLRDLLANMADRVAKKENELEQSYQRMEELARKHARDTERTRILRDMHDGVGSHIVTAIRQLQSGKAGNAAVLHTLRDSLDQLKLSIDALNLPPGDINALLANMRYRLEPRFLACDIHFEWEVDLLEPVTRLDAGAMRQLQFMLFEALSNVLQHAQADTLRVAAQAVGADGRGVRLQIIDNGRGFDERQQEGNGLLSMQERARAIGVLLRMRSTPGRTVVEIAVD